MKIGIIIFSTVSRRHRVMLFNLRRGSYAKRDSDVSFDNTVQL